MLEVVTTYITNLDSNFCFAVLCFQPFATIKSCVTSHRCVGDAEILYHNLYLVCGWWAYYPPWKSFCQRYHLSKLDLSSIMPFPCVHKHPGASGGAWQMGRLVLKHAGRNGTLFHSAGGLGFVELQSGSQLSQELSWDTEKFQWMVWDAKSFPWNSQGC